MIGALTAAGVLLAATVFGLVRRRRDGVLRARREKGEQVGETVGPDDMGAELGDKATLLQFSSAFCAPCRATRDRKSTRQNSSHNTLSRMPSSA